MILDEGNVVIFKVSTLSLKPTSLPVMWLSGSEAARGVTLNTDLHLVYRFRMCGAVSPFRALMTCLGTSLRLHVYCSRNILDDRPMYSKFQEIALCEELTSEEAVDLSKDRPLNETSCCL